MLESVLHVTVDDNRCCGYGICNQICPDVFTLDSGGFAVVGRQPVPPALREPALRAARSCPEGAITVDETG